MTEGKVRDRAAERILRTYIFIIRRFFFARRRASNGMGFTCLSFELSGKLPSLSSREEEDRAVRFPRSRSGAPRFFLHRRVSVAINKFPLPLIFFFNFFYLS